MLTVLSPHRDDAALSVALVLFAAVRAHHPVRIVVPFGRSRYAPHHPAHGAPDAVTPIRIAEDARFAARLGPRAQLVDLGGADALEHPGYATADDYVTGRPFNAAEQARVAALTAKLGAEPAPSLTLVPLAVGDHIDHRLARAAAEATWPADRILYYEDMPYAAGLDDATLAALAPPGAAACVVPGRNHDLYAALNCYPSQLDPAEIAAVLQHARRHGPGERLWGTPSAHTQLSPRLV